MKRGEVVPYIMFQKDDRSFPIASSFAKLRKPFLNIPAAPTRRPEEIHHH